MTDLIKSSLGPALVARVEKKAAALGIADVWADALARARAELGDKAEQADVIRRAGIRAMQTVGVQPPRVVPAVAEETPAAAVSDGPAQNTVSDGPAQAATEEPAAKGKKAKPQE